MGVAMKELNLKVVKKDMDSFQKEVSILQSRLKNNLSQKMRVDFAIKDLFLLSLTQVGELLRGEYLEEGFHANPENKVLNRLKRGMEKRTAISLNNEECLLLALNEVGILLGFDKILLKKD